MQTIEITAPREARRCRFAQYRGETAAVMLNGLTVTGMVRSIMEVKSSSPTRGLATVAIIGECESPTIKLSGGERKACLAVGPLIRVYLDVEAAPVVVAKTST